MTRPPSLADEEYFSEANQERIVRDFTVAYLIPGTIDVDFSRFMTLKDYDKFGYICYWDEVPGKHEHALLSYLGTIFGGPGRVTPLIDSIGKDFLDNAEVRKDGSNRSIEIEDNSHVLSIGIFPEARKKILALLDGEDVTDALDLHLQKEKGRLLLSHSINIGYPTKPPRVLDERFKEFPALLDRYTGRVRASNMTKRHVIHKLYSLIILLLEEKRVKGNFKLVPVLDWQIEKMTKKIANIQKQVDVYGKYFKLIHKKYGNRLSK